METNNWTQATSTINDWQKWGSTVAPVEEQPKEPKRIIQACADFVRDCRARNLRYSSIQKYLALFHQLRTFADRRGLRFLPELNLERCRAFRNTWPDAAISAAKKLERFKTFLNFCVDSEWCEKNCAAKLEHPKCSQAPTMPFSPEEMGRILVACREHPYRASGANLEALVLLLRYSGLRLGDALTLSTDRIRNGRLFLRTAKTGTIVHLPLPELVLGKLAAIDKGRGFYFWTGKGAARTAVGNWGRQLKKIFIRAGVPDGHPHRLRDTFACECLKSGIPIDRVSVLLGHSSVAITSKHYNPWVSERQEQLEQDVMRMWQGEAAIASEKTITGPEPLHVSYTRTSGRVN